MVTVREVRGKKEQKQFLDLPLKLYKGNPYFVPPLYGDEKQLFRADYHYYETSEAVYFLAWRDGKAVGRISGILQRASNEKWGQKRVRFTRFDSIDDQEVAAALFEAVEDWARSKGMTEVCGPLGFSDLEREGLLIEGFDQLSTFEEQYTYEYYPRLIEACGYSKEIDWVESKVYPREEYDDRMDRMKKTLMDRYHLTMVDEKNVSIFLKKYADAVFDLLDKGYSKLYGTVPLTDGAKKMLITNFKLLIKMKYVGLILDEEGNAVCFGLCFPSIAEAVQKSGGKLTPGCLVRILKAANHPKVIDFALICVDPAWTNKGIAVIIAADLDHMMRDNGLSAETNLNLENNYAIQNFWKRFRAVQHKRRRSYLKQLDSEQ